MTDHPVARRHADAADDRGGRRLGRIGAWFTALVLLWLLVGPRIELPGLRGLRVEDLLFAALFVLCLSHSARRRPSGVALAVVGVVVAGLVSAGTAIARGLVDPLMALLFAVRPLEYWVVLPAVVLLLNSSRHVWTRRLEILLGIVTVLQTAFAVLQYYFQVPVGFSHAAYTRAAGLTVGPYELGAISAALVVYWTARGRWTMAAVAVIGLASSISRISVLGAAIALVVVSVVVVAGRIRLARRRGLGEAMRLRRASPATVVRQTIAVALSGFVLALTLGIIKVPEAPQPVTPPVAEQPVPTVTEPADDPEDETQPASPSSAPTTQPVLPRPSVPSESIASRLAGTSVIGSWIKAGAVAEAVPPVRTSAEYVEVAYSHLNQYVTGDVAAALGVEPSNLVRFFRWHLILNTIVDPVDVMLGLGPSFAGPSVDGSYLRWFAEGGVIGVAAWIALVVMWIRRSPLWMLGVTITFLVGALFIDILYAQRPMVLFWALLALATMSTRNLRERGTATKEVPGGI